MIDPLVLHTSLAVSAATWGVLLPDPSRVYQEGWKQKSMAIREMQERLSRRDCSNAVVGAVANLAQLEVSFAFRSKRSSDAADAKEASGACWRV